MKTLGAAWLVLVALMVTLGVLLHVDVLNLVMCLVAWTGGVISSRLVDEWRNRGTR